MRRWEATDEDDIILKAWKKMKTTTRRWNEIEEEDEATKIRSKRRKKMKTTMKTEAVMESDRRWPGISQLKAATTMASDAKMKGGGGRRWKGENLMG